MSAQGALLAIGAMVESDPDACTAATAAAAAAALRCERTGGEGGHLMLSYQWDFQPTIRRLNDSLIARGYETWCARGCTGSS
eukprot:COSAG01_NODE_8391_length_2804_cov_2.002957_3_plen_82_part_00